MHRLHVLTSFVLVAALAPSLAFADDEIPPPPAPIPSALEPAPASAELSLGLSPSGALGFPGFAFFTDVDVGLVVDPRVVLVLGGWFVVSDQQYEHVQIPLSVVLYLDEPRIGAIVPTLRVGIFGQYLAMGDLESLGGGARLGAGITWIADRFVALRLEMLGSAQLSYTPYAEQTQVTGWLGARGSVVVRI